MSTSRGGGTSSFMRLIQGTDTDGSLYQTGKELGKGSYGTVFACKRIRDGVVSFRGLLANAWLRLHARR